MRLLFFGGIMEQGKQILTVTDGKTVTLNGVKNILGFTDDTVMLQIEDGRIVVEGEGLVIESLEKSGGEIVIKGEISGVFRYVEGEKKAGFFGRIFGYK